MKVYVLRHCKASGQEPDAPLTEDGIRQAGDLAISLSSRGINNVISSPYERALASVRPFISSACVSLTLDTRLEERRLGLTSDWMKDLELSFEDEDRCLENGESTAEATERVRQLFDELPRNKINLLVTHGNLMTLLLRSFNRKQWEFHEWSALKNPDLYMIERGVNEDVTIRRVPLV